MKYEVQGGSTGEFIKVKQNTYGPAYTPINTEDQYEQKLHFKKKRPQQEKPNKNLAAVKKQDNKKELAPKGNGNID